MTTRTKSGRRTAKQLAADGFAALVERLGMADAIRYVQLTDRGEGDYTRDRDKWLGNLSHKKVARLIAEAQKPRSK